jgi:hypothetical protein
MNTPSLNLADLMEGGLREMRAHPIAVMLYVIASAVVGYLILWAVGRGTNLGLALLAGLAAGTPISSLLTLAYGRKLRELILDPVELAVRLVFVLAVTLLVSIGAGLAAILLIVPGLYVGARWNLAQPLVLLEGRGIIEAMNRSWQLTEASAWPLVGTTVILAVPNLAFALFGNTEAAISFAAVSPQAILQELVGAALGAFGLAISVFALRELAPPRDELSEVFA